MCNCETGSRRNCGEIDCCNPDYLPPTRQGFFDAIGNEVDYAYRKHSKVLWSRHEFMSILREEFEEAWDDVKADAPTEQLLAEVVQIAAMCLRYVETGDRTRGAHPPIKTR